MNDGSIKTKASKAPAKRRKVAKETDAGTLTLKLLAEQYIRGLERAGKSVGTVFSYRMELDLALAELGDDTPVASITAERVQTYFESDAVTKTRKGRVKAKPTVDKTRRVLRLALEWAAAEKLISKAPIPESAKPRAKTSAEA